MGAEEAPVAGEGRRDRAGRGHGRCSNRMHLGALFLNRSVQGPSGVVAPDMLTKFSAQPENTPAYHIPELRTGDIWRGLEGMWRGASTAPELETRDVLLV